MKFADLLKRSVVFVALSALLSACGGSGGGSETQRSVNTGQFLDGAVAGLSYSSTAGDTGVTDVNGRFQYAAGSTVTFSIGGVTLGSTSGKAFVTPIDFVVGSSAASTQVTNIVRFLLMLDSDGNSNNGITISSAVQAVSVGWTNIDFATVNLDTDLNVTNIIAEVSTADGRVAVLPSAATAQTHLIATVRCANGGAYRGTWSGNYIVSGPDAGNWSTVIDPLTGDIFGLTWGAAATPEMAPDSDLATGALAATGTDNFAVNGTTTSSTFSGTLTAAGVLSGIWNDPSDPGDPGNGTFAGSRVVVSLPVGTPGAVYYGVSRGTSYSSASVFVVAIDGTTVTGNGIDLFDNSSFTVTGTYNSATGALSGTTSDSDGDGVTFSGTLAANGTVNGTFSGANGSGTFNACQRILVTN